MTRIDPRIVDDLKRENLLKEGHWSFQYGGHSRGLIDRDHLLSDPVAASHMAYALAKHYFTDHIETVATPSIWGAQEATGKAPADDVRRRKQSLPILSLRERLDETEREELSRLFSAPNVDSVGVARVLALLEREQVRQEVEAVIAGYHDRAAAALIDAAEPGRNHSRDRLLALVERLSSRSG